MDIGIDFLATLHIIAVAASASQGLMQTLSGGQMEGASAQTRQVLYALQDATAIIGKIAMAVLIVSGVLLLAYKWDFTPPNGWFWIKMIGMVGMLTCNILGERQTALARAGGLQAATAFEAAQRYGLLAMMSFFIAIAGAVFAFTFA